MTIAEARRVAELTQTQLDDLAGLTRGTTADIERGKNKRPSHETVTRIVRAFRGKGLKGISADEMFPVPDASERAGRKPKGRAA